MPRVARLVVAVSALTLTVASLLVGGCGADVDLGGYPPSDAGPDVGADVPDVPDVLTTARD